MGDMLEDIQAYHVNKELSVSRQQGLTDVPELVE